MLSMIYTEKERARERESARNACKTMTREALRAALRGGVREKWAILQTQVRNYLVVSVQATELEIE